MKVIILLLFINWISLSTFAQLYLPAHEVKKVEQTYGSRVIAETPTCYQYARESFNIFYMMDNHRVSYIVFTAYRDKFFEVKNYFKSIGLTYQSEPGTNNYYYGSNDKKYKVFIEYVGLYCTAKLVDVSALTGDLAIKN